MAKEAFKVWLDDDGEAVARSVEAYTAHDAAEVAAQADWSDGGGEWMHGVRPYSVRDAAGAVHRFNVHLGWSPEFTALEPES